MEGGQQLRDERRVLQVDRRPRALGAAPARAHAQTLSTLKALLLCGRVRVAKYLVYHLVPSKHMQDLMLPVWASTTP